jgi:hypothetical protein
MTCPPRADALATSLTTSDDVTCRVLKSLPVGLWLCLAKMLCVPFHPENGLICSARNYESRAREMKTERRTTCDPKWKSWSGQSFPCMWEETGRGELSR